MAHPSTAPRSADPTYERPTIAEVCRMIWLVFGPVGMFFSAAAIWKNPPWTYSVLDVVFWGLAVVVLALRFIDIRLFRGTTTDDQPATLSTWLSYSVKLLALATVTWLFAQWAQA